MDEVHISVRKIKNGYVTSKSWTEGEGDKREYKCEEVFSDSPPDLENSDFRPKSLDEADDAAMRRIEKAYPKK